MRQISELIERSEGDLAQIERTLTDGYAHAHSLEGERWRLERRLSEVAAMVSQGDPAGASELSSLARRLNGNATELGALRDRLGALRRHAKTVRVAETAY